MNSPAPRDLRYAVGVAVVVTALLTFALVDLSCTPNEPAPHPGASHSLAPR
ncbi:hypothetical protein [Horticoccus sp. 23ND18S-11]|uniref:hypothetical protein n=1 Tax=Horticoccus sp. 23ND18S-11 TaxID=3391832 RepID=UPI0039C9DA60